MTIQAVAVDASTGQPVRGSVPIRADALGRLIVITEGPNGPGTGGRSEILAKLGADSAKVATNANPPRVALPPAQRGYRLSARGEAQFVRMGGSSVVADDDGCWLAANESIDVEKSDALYIATMAADGGVGELRIHPLN